MAGVTEANRGLVSAGLRDYLDALIALKRLRNDIQEMSVDVLRQHSDDLGSAIGVPLSCDTPTSYANDDSDSAWLGAQAPIGDFGTIYAGVTWETGEDETTSWVTVAIQLRKRSIFDALVTLLDREPLQRFTFRSISRYRELDLSARLDPARPEDLVGCLAKVLSEWVRFWRQTGGIAGIAVVDTAPDGT